MQSRDVLVNIHFDVYVLHCSHELVVIVTEFLKQNCICVAFHITVVSPLGCEFLIHCITTKFLLFSEIVIKLEPKRDFLTSASDGDLLPWLFESVIE